VTVSSIAPSFHSVTPLALSQFGTVNPVPLVDSVRFGAKKQPEKGKATQSTGDSKFMAGAKLAGIAALGLFFAGPIGAALGGLTMMDMVWGFVVPELLAYGVESGPFAQFKTAVADSIYNPAKDFLTGMGDSWIGRNILGLKKEAVPDWADKKLSWINPAKLHETLKKRAAEKTKNSSLIGSLTGLKGHFETIKKEGKLEWGEAMTHTLYSGIVIARNRMTIRGLWKAVGVEFEKGLWIGLKNMVTRKFWSKLPVFKGGFSIFRLVKSLLIGNIVLRLATEALHASATLFMGKGRWDKIRAEHDNKIEKLDETLEQAEAEAAAKESGDSTTAA